MCPVGYGMNQGQGQVSFCIQTKFSLFSLRRSTGLSDVLSMLTIKCKRSVNANVTSEVIRIFLYFRSKRLESFETLALYTM